MRTAPVAAGWRADVATIAGTVRAHPTLLVPGMLGFALRGGIVALTAPIIVLPTSVEVRLLIGNGIGSTGLTSDFYLAVAIASALTFVFAALALYALARCELALFSRFVNTSVASVEHAWLRPGRLTRSHARAATTRIFVIDAFGLLAVLVVAVPLAAAIGQSTLNEILLPSSADSIYARILRDVAMPLIALVAAIVGMEAICAMTVRRALATAFGLAPYSRIHRHPLRAIAVAVVGWMLFIGAVVLSIAVLSVAWTAVRSVFLSTGLSGDITAIASALVVALLFGVVFAASLLIGGVVSAVRAGLWTLASLR
jgi:hypothetical protein